MTAQEWISNLSDGVNSRVATVNESDIRAIQSDSLREAAEIARSVRNYGHGEKGIHNMAVEKAAAAILARVKELEVGK